MNRLLSPSEAQLVIDNVLSDIARGTVLGSYTSKKTGKINTSSSGLEDYFIDRISSLVDIHGKDIVGTALEGVRVEIDFSDPTLYYPTKDGEMQDWQEEQRQKFKTLMDKFISEVERELEGEDYDDNQPDYDPDSEDDRDLTDEENEEYKRLRKNYSNKKYRQKKKGNFLDELPDFIRVGERTLKDLETLRWFIGS